MTSYIDQADKSCDSALIVPYQFLQPPGSSDLIFSLEKHFHPIIAASIGGDNDCFVFTLSLNKLVIFGMNILKEIVNFKIVLTNEPCLLIVYSKNFLARDAEFKDVIGGFIIASCDEILSYSFDLNLFYRKKFTDETISCLFLISDSEFVVSFKNRKYFDVYKVNEDKLVVRQHFDRIIHFLAANTPHDRIIITEKFESAVRIAVVFESTEIKIFGIRKKNGEIEIELKSHLPPAGFNCYSVSYGFDNMDMCYLFISLNDGSIIFLNDSYIINSNKYNYVKPLINKKDVKFTFNGIYNGNKSFILLIGSDNHIYLYNLDDDNFLEIPGNFEKVTLHKNNETLVAFSNGTIKTFKFNFRKNSNNYNLIQLKTYDVHFDKTSFYFIKDDMILTTSHDSTMKINILSHKVNYNQTKKEFSIETCEKDINKLVYMNKIDQLISLMKNSNRLNIWNLSNGKILNELQSSNDITITNCLCISSSLVVISVNLIEIYDLNDLKIKSKFKFEKKLKKSYYFKTNNESDLLIVSETLNNNQIETYKINVNETQKNTLILKPNGFIDLSSYGSIDDDNVCLTNTNNLLVLSINSELIFIDINSKQIILKRNIENETKSLKYFLTPVILSLNKLKHLKSTFNDNLIGLGNLNNLISINYDSKENKLKIYDSNDSKQLSILFESFIINENKVIAYGSKDQLIGFNLADPSPFSKSIFSIKLNGSVDLFGLSLNNKYVYIVENHKILKFYRWNDNEKIGETQLYCKPINIMCTDDYLSLAMQDRRIISFLIVDPLVPHSADKIKKLESRYLISFLLIIKFINE